MRATLFDDHWISRDAIEDTVAWAKALGDAYEYALDKRDHGRLMHMDGALADIAANIQRLWEKKREMGF